MTDHGDRLPPACERWAWIELIGFDHRAADCGVGAFLEQAGFEPDGLSLLFACPDFVHTHDGLDRETVLAPDLCSYGARPYNAERQRQAWTNHQLRALVEQLHRRGVRVYFSLLNLFACVVDGEPYRSPWCARHPELAELTRTGEPAACINPLKRFADGRYYEDFLVDRLVATAVDYGFDGFHAADGYSSPRAPIWMADFSDDMAEQFAQVMGVPLPPAVAPTPGTTASSARIAARADYLWQTQRRAWCEFYARRFEQLFTKICRALHAVGRQVIGNNAWARDPFEAYDRYGVDYRRLVRAGVDRLVMETVGAGVSIGAESGFRADPRFDFDVMLAFARACLPRIPLLCLNGTGDTTENWDLLNHAPAVSEREIITLGHLFVQDGPRLTRASSGPVVCLADGITASQWQWLRENWRSAYEHQPRRTLGATVVWSAAALEAEIEDYPAHRVLSRQRIAAELLRRGAPLQVVVRPPDLKDARGCLLVPRPELLPESELREVLAYRHGPVVMVGRQAAAPVGADLVFAEGPGGEQLRCQVCRAGRALTPPALAPAPPAPLPAALPDPPNYLYDLYWRPVDEGFLQACADLLIDLSEAPRLVGPAPDLRLLATESEDGTVRLLIGNEAHFYVLGRVDLRRPVVSVRIASHFPGRPIEAAGTCIEARVPPRGLIALDVEVT